MLPPPSPTPPSPPDAPRAFPSGGAVTVRDLAARLGINHSTVSRALRDDPCISVAMRERVRSLARELGYRPDPMLAALSSYRRQRRPRPIQAELAWINGWPSPPRLRSYREFDLYWRGAEDEAARAGFRLTEFTLDRRHTAARLGSIFRARGVRGLLVPPHGDVSLDWTGFPWDAFSVVRFGHSVDSPRAHLVSSNQLQNGSLAFARARALGCRRPGLVVSAHATTRFAAGWLFAQMQAVPGDAPPPLQLDPRDEAASLRALDAWLRVHQPDAVLTDLGGLRDQLARLGRRVPEDIGLAAFSVLDGGSDAGIDQNSEEIGRNALRLLVSLIHHQERGLPAVVRELLIEGRWVDGASLPPRG